MDNLEIWRFLAGIGFFIHGMGQIENVLKNVSGRSLKLFISRNTQNLFKAIAIGAIITGIAQSSSVVSLIVLAFVEAGVITFRNALGLILGTNLGTTLSSWIVATVGFKVNITGYAFPIIAITTIGMFFFEKKRNLYNLFSLFFAIGILFLGLGFMKESAEILVSHIDLSAYTNHSITFYVLFGFVLTTIIQSSAATVALTLTAIYTGVLTFPLAVAIVIGSEVGTTIKILLWGVKGSVDKKRVAWGNFIYNIFTSIIAYLFLYKIVYFIENIVGITDPLIGLVFFQSLINFMSILLFVPFLNLFSNWLERKFNAQNQTQNSYISPNLPVTPTLATDLMQKESENLLNKSLLFSQNILHTNTTKPEGLVQNLKSFTKTFENIENEYQRLKQTEGDLLHYIATVIEKHKVSKTKTTKLLRYAHSARQSVYAAKTINDIAHNLTEFEASANNLLHQQGAIISTEWSDFEQQFKQLMLYTKPNDLSLQIDACMIEIKKMDEKQKIEIFDWLKNHQLTEIEASTLMNVHREIRSCKKSLLKALANLRMDTSPHN
ncbi:MAG: Na/Pi cotransporter family protein [Sphingobacteriales bacterium]|nr:Na/Pi cotransporter family protein [Sphingobacteriales bacterium]